MKKIYRIGTKQEFTYRISPFFKKPAEFEEHWVVRNVKYIYANDKEEAREKYEKWFFKEYGWITKGWGSWYCESDGVSFTMDEGRIKIISTKIVLVDDDKDIDVNLETLKENMQAENFKEWWFDGTIKL